MKLRNQSCQLILGHYTSYKFSPEIISIPLRGILFPTYGNFSSHLWEFQQLPIIAFLCPKSADFCNLQADHLLLSASSLPEYLLNHIRPIPVVPPKPAV